MRHFFEWFADNGLADRPWLILGKGPSLARYRPELAQSYHVLGLNNVCSLYPVDLTHVTDLHVLVTCTASLPGGLGQLVMPWYPHVHCHPGKRPLPELVLRDPALCAAERAGTLLCYRSQLSGKRPACAGPVVPVRYFSAVAAVGLLALAGIKKLRTLGVDGGRSYDSRFDLAPLLVNGRASFDIQFGEIRRICARHGVDCRTLEESA